MVAGVLEFARPAADVGHAVVPASRRNDAPGRPCFEFGDRVAGAEGPADRPPLPYHFARRPAALGRAAARAKWDDAGRRGGAFDIEARLLSAGGAYRWVNVRGAPIPGHEGVVREWIVTVIDAADVKTLAQADDQRVLSGAQIRAAR